MSTVFSNIKSNPLQIILDECTAYLGDPSGRVVVRGEVIVNFSKDTPIQGPIELVFEGIQRYHPWKGM